MKKPKKLYQKVKKILAQQTLPDGFRDNLEELLESYQIYQTELETQNEELREMQLDLDKIRQKYFDLYQYAPVGYLTLSKKGKILDINQTAVDLLTNDQVDMGKDFFSYLSNDNKDVLYLYLQKLWESGVHQSCKLQLLNKVDVQLESILVTDVEIPVCRVSLIDITQSTHQQQQIRTLSKAIEQSPVMVMITDEKGIIEYVNPQFSKVTEYSATEIIGKNPRILKSAKTSQKTYKELWKTITSGNIWRGQLYNRKKNGEFYWENDIIAPVRNKNKITNFIALKEDITIRKQAEENLFKMRKLESLGMMAGGIAHDFNNLLMGILCNVSIAKRKLPNSVFDILEDIEQASFRAQKLAGQLLTFAKGGKAPIKEVGFIKEIIKEAAEFAISGSKVSCQYHFEQELQPIEVDTGQIYQLIHNLILNAIQAMPAGGNIEIFVENIKITSKNNVPPLKSGKYIKITVKDEGHGITQKNLLQIFDPYFTTKDEGSGLGLFVAYSIAKNHHGLLKVESKIEQGTSFSLYLPASRKKITEKIEPDEILSGEGSILLMDDDEMVRNVVSDALEIIGYQVECAKDGDEAIKKYQNAKKPFDVVLLDLTIKGGMGGQEAVKKLLQHDPDAKVIVSSGYSDDPVMANFADYGFKNVIEKPYNLETLSTVIYKTLKP